MTAGVAVAAPARRVRRLHLQAGAEDDAQQAATLLADALHTASIPAADQGRLIVVRRLPLGRISTRLSSAALALHIEAVTREVMSEAVAYDLPAAREANAVIFQSRAAAIVALARLHARGAGVDAWFWPAAVPGWKASRTTAERWVQLVDAAHTGPEAAVASAAIVAEAFAASAEQSLAGSMSHDDVFRWFELEGWTTDPAAVSVRADLALTIPQPAFVDACVRQWGSTDARIVWLSTMLVLRDRPQLAAARALPSQAAAALGRRAASIHSALALPGTRTVPDSPAPPNGQGRATPNRESPAPPTHPTGVREPAAAAAASDATFEGSEPIAEAIVSGEFTTCAGLLFVVPILTRLGFPAYLAARPALLAIDFPARLMLVLGQRAGLPPDDPLARAFAVEEIEHDDSPLDLWIRLVRRWTGRRARMGLASLIRRPARVYVSPTHIDACFDLAAADVRLRRLALDVDPGWVPWIGRVVRFHYGDDRAR